MTTTYLKIMYFTHFMIPVPARTSILINFINLHSTKAPLYSNHSQIFFVLLICYDEDTGKKPLLYVQVFHTYVNKLVLMVFVTLLKFQL